MPGEFERQKAVRRVKDIERWDQWFQGIPLISSREHMLLSIPKNNISPNQIPTIFISLPLC